MIHVHTCIYIYNIYNIYAYILIHICKPWKSEYWKTLNGSGDSLCANDNRILKNIFNFIAIIRRKYFYFLNLI